MNSSNAAYVQYFFTHQALNGGSGLVRLVLSSGHIPGRQYVQSKGVPFMIAVGKTIKPKKYIANFSVVEHSVLL